MSTFVKDKGLVMIIEHLPQFVKPFFCPMQPQLFKTQFAHLWALVLAILINLRTNKLIRLAAVGNDAAAAGVVIYLLLDDMRNGTRGRQMALLSKIYDHKNQCFVRGHIVTNETNQTDRQIVTIYERLPATTSRRSTDAGQPTL